MGLSTKTCEMGPVVGGRPESSPQPIKLTPLQPRPTMVVPGTWRDAEGTKMGLLPEAVRNESLFPSHFPSSPIIDSHSLYAKQWHTLTTQLRSFSLAISLLTAMPSLISI